MHTDGDDSDGMEGIEEEFYVVSRGDFSGSPPLEATGGERWTSISPPPLEPPTDPTPSRNAVAESSTTPCTAASASAPPARPTPGRKMSVTELVSKLDYETPKSLDKRLPVFSEEERAQRASLTRHGHEMRREQEEERMRWQARASGSCGCERPNAHTPNDVLGNLLFHGAPLAEHIRREQHDEEQTRWRNVSKVPCDCRGPHPHPQENRGPGVTVYFERIRPGTTADGRTMPGSFSFGGQPALERTTRDEEQDGQGTWPYLSGEPGDRCAYVGSPEGLQKWMEDHPDYRRVSNPNGGAEHASRLLAGEGSDTERLDRHLQRQRDARSQSVPYKFWGIPEHIIWNQPPRSDTTNATASRVIGAEDSSTSVKAEEVGILEQAERIRQTRLQRTLESDGVSDENKAGASMGVGQVSAPAALDGQSSSRQEPHLTPSEEGERRRAGGNLLGVDDDDVDMSVGELPKNEVDEGVARPLNNEGSEGEPPVRRWLEAEAAEFMRRHMDLSRRAQAQIAEIQRQRLEEQAAGGQPVMAASRSSMFSYDAEGNLTSFREGPSRRFRLGQRGTDGSYHIDEELPPERRSAFDPAPRRHPAESPE